MASRIPMFGRSPAASARPPAASPSARLPFDGFMADAEQPVPMPLPLDIRLGCLRLAVQTGAMAENHVDRAKKYAADLVSAGWPDYYPRSLVGPLPDLSSADYPEGAQPDGPEAKTEL